MKKLLVFLLTICIAFSTFCFTAFAEDGSAEETKKVDVTVGAFYLQGESGVGLMGDNILATSDYNYQIADKLAANLTGTDRIPFYAFDKEGSVYFDSYAEAYFFAETNAAKKAGIDFFAYNLYMGYDSETPTNLINNMNRQLISHMSKYGIKEFESGLKYAVVIDGDVLHNKAKERGILVDILTSKGYQTAEDGRPVVFIRWHENIKSQIEKVNKDLKKEVENGVKNGVPTALNEDVQAMFVVVLDAPSYAEAMAIEGVDAVSWSEGSGKNGEAYANMTARVEANWATGEKVIPNVVTGFDKTLLAGDKAIEVTAKKNASKNTVPDVRYSRSGAADDSVAKATTEELTAHVANAVATTNKPVDFNAVMFYAWDDFLGGAYLCPTKTDKTYQYNTDYIKALRSYFYGKTEGMASIDTLDDQNNRVSTDENGNVTTYKYGTDDVIAKVDKDGKDIMPTPIPSATVAPTATPDGGKTSGGIADYLTYIIIAAAAVVVIAVGVVAIVVVSKKKKKASVEETTEE